MFAVERSAMTRTKTFLFLSWRKALGDELYWKDRKIECHGK